MGVRGDPRSDIFAIGVMLYELACGELPFGDPDTRGGLRQRLWMEPEPPRIIAPQTPAWLQEIILRCLEAERGPPIPFRRAPGLRSLAPGAGGARAARRRSAAHDPWRTRLLRWIKAAGMHYKPSPLPSTRVDEVPIVMVAVPWKDATDATLYSLRGATGALAGDPARRAAGLRHRGGLGRRSDGCGARRRDRGAPPRTSTACANGRAACHSMATRCRST